MYMVTKLGIIPGITFTAIAEAILSRNDFDARALTMEWLRYDEPLVEAPRPDTDDPRVLAVAAAVVEMLAQRAGEEPPAWTSEVAGLAEPFFVIERAERPGFTRTLCLTEAPEPLKRRNIFAPPNYLTFA
jgi:hypothetical protein